VIEENGAMSFVYDDALAALLSEGEACVRRASHVEPEQTEDGVRWFADMTPSAGGVLGPFSTREAALAAEVNWLYANRL
jgi:hypothetical protein